MTVSVFHWSDSIPLGILGLDLKDRAGKSRLSGRASLTMRGAPLVAHRATPSNLQTYADIYGEQVTVDAMANINKYFSWLARIGFTIGGLPTGSSPLSILPSSIRPSNTAISVIGEGLAGRHLAQQRRFVPLSRPIGEGPDLIFQDFTTSPPRTILVEVKTTQQSNVKQQIKDAVVTQLQYARNVATPGNSYSCLLAGVVIRSASDFDLLELEIKLV